MKIVAILPIKHHSERVPGKNYRTLGDRPLWRWIYDALDALPQVDQIVINTDAPDAIPFSKKMRKRMRRPELCGDEVSMNRIIADDLAAFPADAYLMTHATNPFISTATLFEALAAYRTALTNGHDSLFSVTRHQSRFYNTAGQPINHDPAHLCPTQDLPPIYQENSCLYIFSSRSFHAAGGHRIGLRPFRFETPSAESLDIDTEDDWNLAQRLA